MTFISPMRRRKAHNNSEVTLRWFFREHVRGHSDRSRSLTPESLLGIQRL